MIEEKSQEFSVEAILRRGGIEIKPGVDVAGLRPEIVLGILIAAFVWAKHGHKLVLTAGTDGKHSRGSRHYIGLAGDLRSRYFDDDEKEQVAQELREDLGEDYDVVVHSTHIHMEYDPEGPADA